MEDARKFINYMVVEAEENVFVNSSRDMFQKMKSFTKVQGLTESC